MIVIRYKDGHVAVAADWEYLELQLAQRHFRYVPGMDHAKSRMMLTDACRQYTGREPQIPAAADSEQFCLALAKAGLFEVVTESAPESSPV